MSNRAPSDDSGPRLSIVVIAYDMARELPRTLQSLSPGYQRNVSPEDYEVLVVDNGSPDPLGEEVVVGHGPNFRYHYIKDAKPSPVEAVNTGVSLTSGSIICVIIDGARLITPGVIHYGMMAFRMFVVYQESHAGQCNACPEYCTRVWGSLRNRGHSGLWLVIRVGQQRGESCRLPGKPANCEVRIERSTHVGYT